VRILHTSDIHLRDRGDERWETLEKLVAIGGEEKVEILVISGDLFDKGIDAENLRPGIRDVFSGNSFRIVLIPGNHDSGSYGGGKFFGEDAVVLRDLREPLECGDIMLWGMPFESGGGGNVFDRLYSMKNSMNTGKTNILLYHGELLDAYFSRPDFGDEGEGRYMPARISYFKDLNIDYVLAGHFHSRFGIWRLENGGYFVYPGSPVSVTRRETGRRKVNIFEVGEPPQEYFLDTPHYEEIVIGLDSFENRSPVDVVKERLDSVCPGARVILTVGGFINGEKIGMGETELIERIGKVVAGKCINTRYEFRDIGEVVEDELFKRFSEKLEKTDYEEEKSRMYDMAISAMMRART